MKKWTAFLLLSTATLAAQECQPTHQTYTVADVFSDADENGCACQRKWDCHNNGYFETEARANTYPGHRDDEFYDDLTR